MLQAIRSKASSLVVKILFAALILSFGVWGIGDIFRNRSTDTTVATVGGMSISADQLQEAVRADIARLRGTLGTSLTIDQAKQLGIVDAALDHLITADLLQLEVQRLHLAIGDEAVRNAIVGNPNFRGTGGGFDRNVYAQVLAVNRLTETQYEEMTRTDMVRSELTISLTEGLTPPATLTSAFYRAQDERRTADMVTLPASAARPAPTPSPADLDAYYQAHPDRFRTPELRDFTVATLLIDDVIKTITVPDDQLRAEYQSRQAEFHKPEQRQLQQMLFPDEAKAQAAEKMLAAGKSFNDVGKALLGSDPASLDLGWVKRGDLPGPLADAAFALKPGGVTAPIQSSFGWHVIRAVSVRPEQVQSFDAVKSQLQQEIARDRAGDAMAKTANQIDDDLAGGSSLDDVVKKYGLKIASFSGIDAQGHDPSGKPADLPQPANSVLRAVFTTDGGKNSQLADMGETGYFVVHVDKVTPTGIKPLAAAQADAVKLWQADQRAASLQKLADDIAQQVNAGKSLRDVAAAHKLAVIATPPLPRNGAAGVPPALVSKLFDVKPGGAVDAPATEGYAVAQLKEIQPADPAKDPAGVNDLSHQLSQQMQGEFLGAFGQALRSRYKVEINRDNIDRLL
jgi:peptidyl-prolyl cis-trans isomerase D